MLAQPLFSIEYLFLQLLVHCRRCLSSVAHGKDYGSASANNVTSGKDGRDG